MTGTLLLRGMLLGLVAGLLAFGMGRIFGEPQVERAIAFEEQHEKAAAAPAPHVHADGTTHVHAATAAPEAGHSHGEEEVVSRPTQAGLGLFTGSVVYGAAIGGLFALAFAFAFGRLGTLDARGTAAVVALLGFVALVIVPGLKYPANPPAVGAPETIGLRTGLYFGMLAISLVVTVGAVMLARGLWPRFGGWGATALAGLAFLVVVGFAQALLPSVDEVPADFSASLLWNFRVAWLGMQAVLWAVLGLGFGVLAERVVGGSPAPEHQKIAHQAAR